MISSHCSGREPRLLSRTLREGAWGPDLRKAGVEPNTRGSILGSFRLDYEYEIEYEYDFSVLVFRLHIITTHTHFIP